MSSGPPNPNNQHNEHHRRSIRLPKYDYAQPGAYYITVVTYQRIPLFGEIRNGQMILSEMGKIARDQWFLSPELRPYISMRADEFVVMPTHVHGIIETLNIAPAVANSRESFGQPVAQSIPTIVRAYKSAVTYQINAMQNANGSKIWQANYYEHIIRDDEERAKIGHYIRTNPQNWLTDDENGIG